MTFIQTLKIYLIFRFGLYRYYKYRILCDKACLLFLTNNITMSKRQLKGVSLLVHLFYINCVPVT